MQGNNRPYLPVICRIVDREMVIPAIKETSATNNLPEICGGICPRDRLREGNCVVKKRFAAVTIGAVERFITGTAFEQGWRTGRAAPPGARLILARTAA